MLEYLRVDWNKVLGTEAILIARQPPREKWDRIKGALKEICTCRPAIDREGEDAGILFFKSMSRPDYDDLFRDIYDACPVTKASIDYRFLPTSKLQLGWIYVLFRYFPVFFSIRAASLLDLIFLYLRTTKTMLAYHHLKRTSCRALVVFADMQCIDSLLVQLANRRKIKTATLQHGLYVDYSDHFNVNVVNYKNAVSQDFLAWGENTRELIHKYHPSINVTICGKPIKQQQRAEPENHYFTMICDQNVFFSYNLQLLQICYEYCRRSGLRVNLRLHPNNKLKWFEADMEKTLVNEDLWGSSFLVGHTSSLIYECLRVGLPSFKFLSDIPSIATPPDLCFSDADGLARCAQSAASEDFDGEDLGRQYVDSIGQDSLEKYAKYFQSIWTST